MAFMHYTNNVRSQPTSLRKNKTRYGTSPLDNADKGEEEEEEEERQQQFDIKFKGTHNSGSRVPVIMPLQDSSGERVMTERDFTCAYPRYSIVNDHSQMARSPILPLYDEGRKHGNSNWRFWKRRDFSRYCYYMLISITIITLLYTLMLSRLVSESSPRINNNRSDNNDIAFTSRIFDKGVHERDSLINTTPHINSNTAADAADPTTSTRGSFKNRFDFEIEIGAPLPPVTTLRYPNEAEWFAPLYQMDRIRQYYLCCEFTNERPQGRNGDGNDDIVGEKTEAGRFISRKCSKRNKSDPGASTGIQCSINSDGYLTVRIHWEMIMKGQSKLTATTMDTTENSSVLLSCNFVWTST